MLHGRQDDLLRGNRTVQANPNALVRIQDLILDSSGAQRRERCFRSSGRACESVRQDQVHPTCHRSNLILQVTGPVVAAGVRHGKVRRDGYRKG
jgi:hypothetical protein